MRSCGTAHGNCRGEDEGGATTVEYAVMVAAVAAVIVVAVFLLGDVVHEAFTDTCDLMDTEADISAEC